MKTETIVVRGGIKEKQQSSERRKKATKDSVRTAVGETPVLANQLAAPSYKVSYVAINAINVNFTNRRAVIPKLVETLVRAIPVDGLRIPLSVSKVGDATELVSGLQRLEALKILDWKEVPCIYIEGDEILARRCQISENAHRAGLSKLEKANQTAEWIELSETLERISGEKFQKTGRGRPEGGNSKAARTLPMSGKSADAKRKNVAQDRKIASIHPAAQQAAIEAGLDNEVGKLVEIADQKTPGAQLAKIRELAKRGKKSSAPDHSAADAETHFQLMARTWRDKKKLNRSDWEKASKAERRQFITEVLYYRLKKPKTT
jgi:ParB family chromosome partitioning protein